MNLATVLGSAASVMGAFQISGIVGSVTLQLWLGFSLAACSGKTFGNSTADAAVTQDTTATDAEDDQSEPFTDDECDTQCAVPDCPPQNQYTPEGECCPVCEEPATCQEGVRCDMLSCAGAMQQVNDECCVCEGSLPECEEPALPCTDSACLGAAQEVLGDGCCICGEPLSCAPGQAPCVSIVCDGQDPLYKGGDCCACAAEEGCGGGSSACDSITCSSGVDQVGGGCCVCEDDDEEVVCESPASACADIDCPFGSVEQGDGCCQCVDECGLVEGETNCDLLDCVSEPLEISPGCCMCEGDPMCSSPSVRCDDLSCPFTSLVDDGTGCCTCYECAEGSGPCGNIECGEGFEPAPIGDGCCTCEATMMFPVCDEELQNQYSNAKAEIIEELGAPACEMDEDCELITLINECRAECAVPVHREISEALQTQAGKWAAEHCQGCPETGADCPAIELVVRCFGGRCLREDTQ